MTDASPVRVSILASGGGSNFQALIDRFEGGSEVRLVGLAASREGTGAEARARRHGIAARVIPGDAREREGGESDFLARCLDDWGTELVVLAGYLRLVPAEVVGAFRGRIINIHPALLPAFGGKGMYGSRVHRAVVASGARVSGATVHFVDEAYDRGPIIAQWPVPVLSGDTPQALAGRVLEIEHRLLPAVVRALARGRVRLSEEGQVRWVEEWFDGERFELGTGEPGTPGRRE
ncbi:MAG: phosphoribosylglycinamide formyltransferase [Gemmatimonadota bacterium]|nr:phosphoribosylglycinamide formyltransferase [Gemmatimonadota bacterium]